MVAKLMRGFMLFLLIVAFLIIMLHDVLTNHGFELDYEPDQDSYSNKKLDEEGRGFDQHSCISRYDILLHNQSTTNMHIPSSYLKSKLRRYEARHKRCAPNTYLYNMTTEALKLKSNKSAMPSECKYTIWMSNDGMANRILSVTSAFLYAILTDRVLLVYPKDYAADLFCEPFPEGSWMLPLDFPIADRLEIYNENSHSSFWEDSFGELVQKDVLSNSSTSSLPYVYVYLNSDSGYHDKRFFCDEQQSYLKNVPWLIIRSNQYFLPSFFTMSCFEHELGNLFPNKGYVFHLLGRYLLHPSNDVWGLVRRFYDAYLSDFDVKVGIQIRIFEEVEVPIEKVPDQIVSCAMKVGLLPHVAQTEHHHHLKVEKKKKISVLITSLNGDYFKQLRRLYWMNATLTGDIVAIQQPSFEEFQNSNNQDQNKKAVAEMYLLSLTDQLLTSEISTFGYVARGLGGLNPWMIFMSKIEKGDHQACHRVSSIEPCYHKPPNDECKSVIKPHVRECVDYPGGIST